MRVRLFVEVELRESSILATLGETDLPPATWEQQLSSGLARQTEAALRTLHSVENVKAVYIPKLI